MNESRDSSPSLPECVLLSPQRVVATTRPFVSTSTDSSTGPAHASILFKKRNKLDLIYFQINHFKLTSDEKRMMLLSYSPSSLSFSTTFPMAMSMPVTMAEKILLSYIPGLSFSVPGYWDVQIQEKLIITFDIICHLDDT